MIMVDPSAEAPFEIKKFVHARPICVSANRASKRTVNSNQVDFFMAWMDSFQALVRLCGLFWGIREFPERAGG